MTEELKISLKERVNKYLKAWFNPTNGTTIIATVIILWNMGVFSVKSAYKTYNNINNTIDTINQTSMRERHLETDFAEYKESQQVIDDKQNYKLNKLFIYCNLK